MSGDQGGDAGSLVIVAFGGFGGMTPTLLEIAEAARSLRPQSLSGNLTALAIYAFVGGLL